jgi:hypothetical protein
MELNGHSHIDIFKADIEGAALPILEQMIDQEIYPSQIVVEFERPKKNQTKIDSFFNRVDAVRDKLKHEGFLEYQIPREKGKYYSIEFLFINL